jgi:hypothetical protein
MGLQGPKGDPGPQGPPALTGLFKVDGDLVLGGGLLSLGISLPAGTYEVTAIADILNESSGIHVISCNFFPDEGSQSFSMTLPDGYVGTVPLITTFTGPGTVAIQCDAVEDIPIVGRIIAMKVG